MTDGLLLIHPFPLDGRAWEPQIATFAGGVPVVAPHLPGFGGSPSAGAVMSMSAAARRCLEEVDRGGIDLLVVCGLSMGGYVALELWRQARERVAGLVLANTRAEVDSPEGRRGRLELAERLRAEGSAFLVAEPPALLSEGAPAELREKVRSLIADQPAESIAAAALGMAERPDSTGDLPGIGAPVLVVTSSEDALIPPSISAPMADAIPGAELVAIDGVGHLSNLEAPDDFNVALERHLERCGLL